MSHTPKKKKVASPHARQPAAINVPLNAEQVGEILDAFAKYSPDHFTVLQGKLQLGELLNGDERDLLMNICNFTRAMFLEIYTRCPKTKAIIDPSEN